MPAGVRGHVIGLSMHAVTDAFRPDLATSLNNLSADLADMGRREEALAAIEKAVAIRRQLAAALMQNAVPGRTA